MKRWITALAAPAMLGLLAVPALAANGFDEARVSTLFYQPDEVVTINGRIGIQTTIEFETGERIENIAVGNSAAWQVTPNKRADLLFIKPLSAAARTNMTVITDRRTYLFDLVVASDTAALYMLRFTYPEPPPSLEPEDDMLVTQVAELMEPVSSFAVTDLNFNWKAKGEKRLIPARYFDDGQSVFLEWPADATLPAILIEDASGDEGPVNYSVQEEFIVVDGVPDELILRSGKRTAKLIRGAPVTSGRSDQRGLPVNVAERK